MNRARQISPSARTVAVIVACVAGVAVAAVIVVTNLHLSKESHLADFRSSWYILHSFIERTPVDLKSPFFQGKVLIGNPGTHSVLLSPIGLLPMDVAQWASAAIIGLALVVPVFVFAGLSVRALFAGMILALSYPALVLIYIGHFPTAISVLAFTVMAWSVERGRWWLVGSALVVGLLRTANAPTILGMVAVILWRNRPAAKIILVTAVVIVIPTTIIAFIIQPGWLSTYISGLGGYQAGGFAGIVKEVFGTFGTAGLQLIGVCAAGWITLKYWSPHTNKDVVALCMALSSVVAPAAAAYAFVFGLPALLRIALRPAGVAFVIVTALGTWLLAWGTITSVPAAIAGPTAAMVTTIASVIVLARDISAREPGEPDRMELAAQP